jgi:hypothetical protein
MSKQSPRLEGGLIVRKGEAVPAVTAQPVAIIHPTAAERPAAVPVAATVSKGIAGTIAVTVRLDPVRYERLKVHGARRRQTNQQIIVAALDAYLADGGA